MLKRILPLALAGYALWQWQHHCTQKRHKKVSAKPEEVTTWEGEGGALHGTSAQLGPEPNKSSPLSRDLQGGVVPAGVVVQ